MAGAAHVIKMSSVVAFFAEEPRLIKRGEDAIEANHIKSMVFDGDLLIIRGEVWASEKKRLYNVEITLDNELCFQEASCTCARGVYMCHHMSALGLYAHYNVASTDVTCRWNERKSAVDEVHTMQELYPLPQAKENYSPLNRPVTNEDAQYFYQQLNNYSGAVGFTWLLKPEVETDQVQLVPDIEEIIFSQEYLAARNQEEYLRDKLCVSKEHIQEIAKATRGQSKNPNWLLARKHRLTASRFGRILNAIKRNSFPRSLYKTLTESYDLEGVKAIQWGRTNEGEAIRIFQMEQGLNVKPCGLFLHECGFLGASPDGLIEQTDLLEIKCPYKFRNSKNLKEDIKKEKKYIFNYNDNGEMVLNSNHDYYHQVQGQLCMTNRERAYLMIWTPKENITVIIQKDEEWKTNIELLKGFYFNHYIKYITGLLDI